METRKRPTNVAMPVNKSFRHDLSHRHTTTLDFFRLQPILCQDVLPGDKMRIDMRTIIQSAPLATQVFGGAHLDLHAFFVPNRILWENWDAYLGGDTRSAFSEFTLPQVTGDDLAKFMGHLSFNPDQLPTPEVPLYKERRRVFGSLGYPTNSDAKNVLSKGTRFSLLQARAYQRIWWDYYRDSVNIPEADKIVYNATAGGVGAGQFEFDVRYRTFKKDFISTLLPTPQLGDASGAELSIISTGNTVSSSTPMYTMFVGDNGELSRSIGAASSNTRAEVVARINAQAMRGATALQRYLERLNIVGTRTMERLLAIFGVKPSAERLDMAEFIGGHTVKVNIDGLVNSGSSEEVSSHPGGHSHNAWGIYNGNGSVGGNHLGQGFQTGYGNGSGNTPVFEYTAQEHGHILVIASLIPEFVNPNSVSRQFFRGVNTVDSDKFDFFTPDFDGLGYQEMLACEVAYPTVFDNDAIGNVDGNWNIEFDPFAVVGYQPKYEDYRFVQDRISGDFMEDSSAMALRNMVFCRSIPRILEPSDVVAGLALTTSDFSDRALFDQHFQITDSSLDHFVLHTYIVNDATREVTNNQLPTELSDLANSSLLDVANGGVRL